MCYKRALSTHEKSHLEVSQTRRWTAEVNTLGRHLLVEYYGCDPDVLDDEARIRTLMRDAARAAGATEVAVVFHRFSPQGVSGVVVVEESHLSIHTWPEYGYAAVDFYTCGECDPKRAHDLLKRGLQADEAEVMEVERGLDGPRSMRVGRHDHERKRPGPARTAATEGSRAAHDG